MDYLRDDLAKRGLLSMPRAQTDDQMVRRGLIETSAGVDYNNNMDQFITEESESSNNALSGEHNAGF